MEHSLSQVSHLSRLSQMSHLSQVSRSLVSHGTGVGVSHLSHTPKMAETQWV